MSIISTSCLDKALNGSWHRESCSRHSSASSTPTVAILPSPPLPHTRACACSLTGLHSKRCTHAVEKAWQHSHGNSKHPIAGDWRKMGACLLSLGYVRAKQLALAQAIVGQLHGRARTAQACMPDWLCTTPERMQSPATGSKMRDQPRELLWHQSVCCRGTWPPLPSACSHWPASAPNIPDRAVYQQQVVETSGDDI